MIKCPYCLIISILLLSFYNYAPKKVCKLIIHRPTLYCRHLLRLHVFLINSVLEQLYKKIISMVAANFIFRYLILYLAHEFLINFWCWGCITFRRHHNSFYRVGWYPHLAVGAGPSILSGVNVPCRSSSQLYYLEPWIFPFLSSVNAPWILHQDE